MYAASLLLGKRPSWGAERMWRSDYLSSPTENIENANYTVALNNLKNSDRFNQVLIYNFLIELNYEIICFEQNCCDAGIVFEFHSQNEPL